MGKTERQKMSAGDWYTCIDDELEDMRRCARRAVHAHNICDPDQRGGIAPELAALLADVGRDVFIEAPFHCAYGCNITLGHGVYINAGATFLDTAQIHIGAGTLIGPNVQIYCAEHHKGAAARRQGLEIARAVEIGADVWIGGGAILLPGVTIGVGAIVGAGSVVVRDVAQGETAVGNPAHPVAGRVQGHALVDKRPT